MGALAPAAPWIPEDDFLLKHAVETGASLESLAKGAVRFSRRYTVREIQERWYSLLYDPVISAEASVHMIEFEQLAPTLTSKFTKFGDLKGNKYSSGKRKTQSVRSCYYALRKRICNEPFNSEDFDYLVGPSNGIRTVDGTLTGDYMLGDPNSSHFELQESDLEIVQHAFPNLLMDGVISTNNAFAKDVEKPTEGFPVEQDDLSRAMPSPLKRDAGHMELFETNNIGAKSSPAFAPSNHNGENTCQEMEQTHVFNSPILDCGASFHGLDCSSPLPDMPIWKAVEGMSTPDDLGLGEKDLCIEEALTITNDDENKNVGHSGDSTKGYLAELSESLLNFTNEEELLFMDVDAKDPFDKSYYDGLSSLLLNSPIDANQEGDLTDVPQAISAAVASKTNLVPDDICKSEECMASSVSGSGLQFSETCDGFMLCALNTEDPDIPCNDDVVFPKMFGTSSAFVKAKSRFQESKNCIPSALGKDLSANPRTVERGPGISQGQYHGLSQSIGPLVSVKNSANPTVGSARGTKCEVSNSNVDANLADISDRLTVRLENMPTLTLKEEQAETSGVKHLASNSTDCALEKPLNDSDKFQFQQQDAPPEVRDPLDSELGTIDPAGLETGTGPCSSAPEQIESDDDLASFSDIEAMILDMDLDPDDQDFFSNEEVSRYNNEAARRTIVRLEQGAHSYMQRAIASHKAFAVLYGHYSKHYIRKQEVLLGRGTEGFKVDIDLGTEGRSNKISRRQATIKLEKNGSCLLRNLGNKFSIFVNNKPVAPGLSLTLTPNCLIEIRGTPFIFDVNPSCVKQFLGSTSGNQQEQS
ncbi:uncharacterized protein LOC116193946 [Punica granatum]|uniref:Uncharacterized protein LOC116193946 n=1 Tax=Punica granatum TaxID=22663 RepID=A0A218X936_PUNGR|nr:uncharacterized protein LOC116193946 [Punica granatum]OWM80892.1 hypothetical protein CDL15_Pgr006923 [Punica granatum]